MGNDWFQPADRMQDVCHLLLRQVSCIGPSSIIDIDSMRRVCAWHTKFSATSAVLQNFFRNNFHVAKKAKTKKNSATTPAEVARVRPCRRRLTSFCNEDGITKGRRQRGRSCCDIIFHYKKNPQHPCCRSPFRNIIYVAKR